MKIISYILCVLAVLILIAGTNSVIQMEKNHQGSYVDLKAKKEDMLKGYTGVVAVLLVIAFFIYMM